MPEFGPGTAKTAITPITVNPSGLSCQAELFLGPDELTKAASSGRVPFVSTGARQDVRLLITMPPSAGTYHAYIDVYAESMLIAAYKAIEDVVIEIPVVLSSRAQSQLNVLAGQGFITYVTPDTYRLMNLLADFAYYDHLYASTHTYFNERAAAREAATAEIQRLGMPGYARRSYPGVPSPVGGVHVDDVVMYTSYPDPGERIGGAIIFPQHCHSGYDYWKVVDERLSAYHPFQTC